MVKIAFFKKLQKMAKKRQLSLKISFSPTFIACFMVNFLLIFQVGCGDIDPAESYSSRELYRTDIKTVHVKIFENKSFDRRVEYELHGVLCRQIELHTPFKVVSDRHKADTIIYGQILSVSEKVLAQQRELDRPLESLVVLAVNVNWKDLRNAELLIDNQRFRVSGQYANLAGGGRGSAVKEAANEMARRIVETMEQPW